MLWPVVFCSLICLSFTLSTQENNDDNSLVFAVIGDYGMGNSDEADVAALVDSWNPSFIITLGDNNYPLGDPSTIDPHIGQYYSKYIYPYKGSYPPSQPSTKNRFFPSPGNHDWVPGNLSSYLNYFSGAYSLAPFAGGTYYYNRINGLVDLFSIDSGVTSETGDDYNSVQAKWVYSSMSQISNDPTWKFIFFHYPPYSSSRHGSTESMRWNFTGFHSVLAGHDHSYERLYINNDTNVPGPIHFVNGLGGAGFYDFPNILPQSLFRYNSAHGAQRVYVNKTHAVFQFINVQGAIVDTHTCYNFNCAVNNTNNNNNNNNNDGGNGSTAMSALEAIVSIIVSISALVGVLYFLNMCYRMREESQRRNFQREVQLEETIGVDDIQSHNTLETSNDRVRDVHEERLLRAIDSAEGYDDVDDVAL